MTQAFENERSVAIDAVRHASHVCRAVQAQLAGSVLEKDDRSPVTVADFASQAMICRALREAFPADPVVAEEDSAALREAENASLLGKVVDHAGKVLAGSTQDDVLSWIDHGGGEPAARFWTLDPIDGTKGFLRGEQYAVALALLVDGQPVVAAVGCPNLHTDPADPSSPKGVIFTAVRGEGAEALPLDGDAASVAVRVNANADPAQARFCESVEKGHSSHSRSARVAQAAGIVNEPVRLDSQAKYVVVARGEADAYMRFARGDYKEKIWDHAAGYLVNAEAGGRASDQDGKPLDFSKGKRLEGNRGVIVTNGALHDRILAAIAEVDSD